MNYSIASDEVLYTTEPVTAVNHADIQRLIGLAAKNPRQRIRLCAHPDTEDRLHEMLIVHAKGTYVRPHKHPGKSESFHMIGGQLQVVLFEDDGRVKDVISMDEVRSGDTFYYRLSEGWFHTVIPTSTVVVFHETTNGPFKREETLFAPWAPEEDNYEAQEHYLKELSLTTRSRP